MSLGWKKTVALAFCLVGAISVQTFADDVTNNVIFGSGNGNGFWTIDRDQASGVELGLRGKVRGQAVYNYDGGSTYTFNPGVPAGKVFPASEWNYEWSINTDYTGTSGRQLNDLIYTLQMSSTNGASMAAWDLINLPLPGLQWRDHSMGDNSTAQSAGIESTDATSYAANIATYSLAQNSWQPYWEGGTNFNPNLPGTYTYTLKAFLGASEVASTSINVVVVPTPKAALAGLTLFVAMGAFSLKRKLGRA